jgi:hypothetical protein
MPTVMRDTIHKPEDGLARPLLTSLIEKRKRDGMKLNLSMDGLMKDSNLRRNQLVLENVLRAREKESWLQEASIKLQSMQKESKQHRQLLMTQQQLGHQHLFNNSGRKAKAATP